ncbi:MAG: DUF2135 domain-containing protein [Planctomycetota bacterium]|nr:DUF2135 domain-containing protein [Planctomycetota bacterium]
MRVIISVSVAVIFGALLAQQKAPLNSPEVSINSPAGGWTSERIVTVSGKVRGEGVGFVTLVLNGVSQKVLLKGNTFSLQQVLAPGENVLSVYAENKAGVGADTVYLFSSAPRKDLRVTLTWDTIYTDMDLWVSDPNGEKCYYENTETKIGGSLDTDETNGYGPETFTLSRCVKGPYTVQVHYFGGGKEPTFCKVEVVKKEGTPQEERKVYRFLLRRPGEVCLVTQFFVATED